MKKKETVKPTVKNTEDQQNNDVKGYPLYPAKDDIYKRAHEEKDIDPDNLDKIPDVEDDLMEDEVKELGLDDEIYGGDLDVPGSELDDEGELTGNEDEENNYYSIGGDNHSDLDENHDDE